MFTTIGNKIFELLPKHSKPRSFNFDYLERTTKIVFSSESQLIPLSPETLSYEQLMQMARGKVATREIHSTKEVNVIEPVRIIVNQIMFYTEGWSIPYYVPTIAGHSALQFYENDNFILALGVGERLLTLTNSGKQYCREVDEMFVDNFHRLFNSGF